MSNSPNLFEGKPDIWDWADEVARQVVTDAFDLKKGFEFKDEDLPWCLATALAVELRGIRGDFERQAGSKIEAKAQSRTRRLRQELTSPSFLAELCRERATQLDDKGWTGEAGVLREAATILEEDIK